MRPKSKAVPRRPQKPIAPPYPTAPRTKHFLAAAIALCALVIIAYTNSLSNGFIWDDHRQIVMNPVIRPQAPLAPLITTDARFANFDPANQTTVYRPLQMLTYRGVLALFGANPTAFHLCSVAFALAGALAAFWLFWLLMQSLPLAFAAAALFAVHPVHTEAVDWIAALPDLGCGLFFLLAFSLYRIHRKGLSLAAFAIALLWKETAVVFPALLAAYILLQPRQLQPKANRLREALKTTAPYWAILAIYLGVRTAILGAISHSPRTWSLNPLQFLLTTAHLLASYCLKLAVPIDLNAYYVFHPIRSLTDPRAAFAILLLACVATLLYFLRQTPPAAFAIVWTLITILPALNLNALGRNAFTERYLYLPSVGFCLLIVLASAWLLNGLPANIRKPATATALIAILAALTTETIARNPDWKNDATLFAATLPLAPDSPFVHVMVATSQTNDPAAASSAEYNFLQAIDLAKQETPPDRLDAVVAYQGLASLYADRGQFDQALAQLTQSRALAPENPDADGEQGIILAHAGRGKEAEPILERARQKQPLNENILTALGLIARDDLHDLPRAAALFAEVLALHTQSDDFTASTHNNLGAVYDDQNNLPAAIDQFRQATAIAPADPGFHMNLASALAAAGQFPEAREQAKIALQLAPNDPAARDLFTRLQSPNP
jgi:protein O-mannosyl-transferase